MLSGRSIYALTLSEQAALRRQWLRSGQCLRCFHASITRRAADENKDSSIIRDVPKGGRGPTRHQRAAKISDELKMIQRDHPSPTFSEPDPNTLRPPGAGQTVDPAAVGESVAPGRMGENDSPTQEGPLGQGVGKEASSKDDVQDTSKMAQGVRSPDDSVEDPAKGGTAVLEVAAGSSQVAEDRTKESVVKQGFKTSNRNLERFDTEAAISKTSSNSFRQNVVHGRYNTSTIAGGRFGSVIADHVSHATRQAPTKRKTRRDPTPQAILQKVVAGKFDVSNYLSGPLKQPSLNEIARATSLNGTYMPKDTEKFLEKMRSLLPAAPAQRAGQRAKEQPSKDA